MVNLRFVRKEHGLTQQELAERLGFRSKGTINMIESGLRQCSVETALKIERLFKRAGLARELVPPEKRHLLPPAEGAPT